jgi:hypothetical protein
VDEILDIEHFLVGSFYAFDSDELPRYLLICIEPSISIEFEYGVTIYQGRYLNIIAN